MGGVGIDCTALLDRIEEMARDRPASAEALAQAVTEVATDRGADDLLGRGHYLIARIAAERGQLDRALAEIELAQRGFSAAGQPILAARTDLGRMQILDDQGRHREALEVGLRLLTRLDALNGAGPELTQWIRGTAWNNIGVAHGYLGQHELTLQAYAEAEAAYRALGLTDETAKVRANSGIELLELGRAWAARQMLAGAAAEFEAEGDRLWAAKCAGHLASADYQLGDLVSALALLQPAWATLAELGSATEAARIRLALAEVYLAANLPREAAEEAEGVIETAALVGLRHDEGAATLILALAALSSDDLVESARLLDRAAEVFAEVDDRRSLARVTVASADLARRRGDLEQSLQLAVSAGETARAAHWPVELVQALLRQVDAGGGADGGAAAMAEAGRIADELGLPQLRFGCALRDGRALRGLGRVDAAAERFRAALSLAEQVGEDLPDPLMQTAARADLLATVDELMDLLLRRGRPEDFQESCRLADWSRSRTLRSLLRRPIREVVGERDDDAVSGARQLDELRQDLSAAYAALWAAPGTSRAPLIQQRARDLERRIGAVSRQVALAERRPAATDVASPGAQPEGSVVLFHVAADDVVAFVIRDGHLTHTLRSPGVVPQIRSQLGRLAAQWAPLQLGGDLLARHASQLEASARQTLRRLHDLILAPVERADPELVGAGLTVVPHRLLHRVPFHALDDGSAYLVERCAVTLAPTLEGAGPRQSDQQPERRDLMIFAVPDHRAPAIAAEAEALASLPNSWLELGDQATSARLRQAMPGPRRLHLACHGLYRATNPLYSSLRLADRWVTGAEMLDVDLGGAMVTLSACESGLQDLDAAEPVGLAWAFLAAGASGVVVSQWLVNDTVAAQLMPALHSFLAAGEPPATALRRAQLDTMAEHPHPFHWAAFSYVAAPASLGKRAA